MVLHTHMSLIVAQQSPQSRHATLASSSSHQTGWGHSQRRQQALPNAAGAELARGVSNASSAGADGRDKSVIWDKLWTFDVSYPGK